MRAIDLPVFRQDAAVPRKALKRAGMTLDDIERDIVESKRRLQQLAPDQQEMSLHTATGRSLP